MFPIVKFVRVLVSMPSSNVTSIQSPPVGIIVDPQLEITPSTGSISAAPSTVTT